jgi:TldD protein
MKKFLAIATILAVGLSAHGSFAQKPATSPVLQALEQEMNRAFGVLKQKGDPAPYFISYSVREDKSINIEASHGALRSSDRDNSRLLDVDVRVGDYQLDNTHQIRGQRGTNTGPSFTYPVLMPNDDDVDALRSVIWL